MPRVLSIYLPDWPIALAKRKKQTESDRPLHAASRKPTAWLLWSEHRATKYVTHACERATKAGVRTGMTLSHAQSLLAGVQIEAHPHTPESAATALRRLAEAMLRFAPTVVPDDPDGLILDIAGCEGVFKGERRHTQLIAATLRGWGLRSRFAVAPTTACAWAVARFGPDVMTWIDAESVHDALALLPVAALRLDERIIDMLADVGIERIEHLLAQSRDALAARFGLDLLRRLDLATGVVNETMSGIQPERRFELRHVFEGPIRKPEIIEATTRELLQRLLQELHAVQYGVQELNVELRRVAAEPVTLTVQLTVPSNDFAHVWRLLSHRIEGAHLGYDVEEIVVYAVRTGRVKNEQAAFLRDASRQGAGSSTALGELVDCLMDRLGTNAVTRIRPVATYVPERAFAHTSLRDEATSRDESPVEPSHRPTELFDMPEPARVMSLVPDGPPMQLEWRGEAATIVSGVGPERITFPWWTDGRASRDYYEIADTQGRRLWVFRDGVSGQWFVHGEWT